jgi:hypothetical protein
MPASKKAHARKRRPVLRTASRRRSDIRLNVSSLSEDDADYLYYLKHKDEKRYPLKEVMRQAGIDVER